MNTPPTEIIGQARDRYTGSPETDEHTRETGKLDVPQLVLLALTMFVAMLSLTLPVVGVEEFVGRLLPQGGEGLAFENTARGLFVSAHFLAYIPFAFFWGALSDRYGRRKPILLMGLLGQSIMFALMPLVPNIWLLYLVRFIEGTFSIAVVTILMTMAVDIAPAGRRGLALGVFTLGMLLGNTVGVLLGGVLARASYEYPFWLGSALLLLMFGVVALFVRDGKAVNPAHSFGKALSVFREHPRLAIPYSFSFLDRLTVGFFVGTFPIMAAEIYGLDAAQRGAYLGVFLACFALLSPLGGLLSDRMGRVLPMLVGTAVYGLMLMLVGRVSAEMLYLVMIVGGVSGAVLYPPSIAMVGDYAGSRQRGVAMGGFNLAGSIGYAAGPLLFSLIADGFGLLTPPLVAGALCLAAVAVAWPLLLGKRALDPGLQPAVGSRQPAEEI